MADAQPPQGPQQTDQPIPPMPPPPPPPPPPQTKKGLPKGCIIALAVAGVVLVLLLAIGLPVLSRVMELARRSMCGANLNTIGKGVHIYMTEYEDFPLLHRWGNVCDTLGDKEEIWDLSPHAMQNFWLLMQYGISDQAFQCPSDAGYQERRPEQGRDLQKYGWVKKENFSFGIHKPYENDANSPGSNKAPLTQTLPGTFVIMTDKSNGRRIYWDRANDRMGNDPANHPDDGFNCLLYQGSVKFHKCEVGSEDANSAAGIEGDDVFVDADHADSTDEMTGTEDPDSETDTFIVPHKAAERP